MDSIAPTAEAFERLKNRHANTPLLSEERLNVARVYNIISILAKMQLSIDPSVISGMFQASLNNNIAVKDMMLDSNKVILLATL